MESIAINAVAAWLCASYVMWYAIKRANGRKWIRIITATVIYWYALVYTLAMAGVVDILDVPSFLRPLIPVLFMVPVWESWADVRHKETK